MTGTMPLEKPILFQGRLVRGILADQKSQTRRLVKPQPPEGWHSEVGPYHPTVIRRGMEEPGPEVFGASDEDAGRVCPYGGPGTTLWVREAWQKCGLLNRVHYRATSTKPYRPANPETDEDDCKGKWKPGIHMPRAACRLRLEVMEVRVQRLQDISEEDAIAEGVQPSGNGWLGPVRSYRAPRGMKGATKAAGWTPTTERLLYPTAREAFRHLWDSINAKRPGASWDENPWVWVIDFKKVQT